MLTKESKKAHEVLKEFTIVIRDAVSPEARGMTAVREYMIANSLIM